MLNNLFILVCFCLTITLSEGNIQLLSTLGIKVVVFIQTDGEHGLEALPGAWVQVVLVGGVDQIVIAGRGFVLEAVLVALLHRVRAVVVRHRVVMATAGLLGRPVEAAAAKYHHRGHSDQQQEGAASHQQIVPVGVDGRHRHCVNCGLHPRHGTPWRAGGHITGWHFLRREAGMQAALGELLIG